MTHKDILITIEQEGSQLLKDASSEDPLIAIPAQKIMAEILSEPLKVGSLLWHNDIQNLS